jgi:hypothetical protein
MGSNPDISQKYKMGNISKLVANTYSSPLKNIQKKYIIHEPLVVLRAELRVDCCWISPAETVSTIRENHETPTEDQLQ